MLGRGGPPPPIGLPNGRQLIRDDSSSGISAVGGGGFQTPPRRAHPPAGLEAPATRTREGRRHQSAVGSSRPAITRHTSGSNPMLMWVEDTST
jgi:hypothetical protein